MNGVALLVSCMSTSISFLSAGGSFLSRTKGEYFFSLALECFGVYTTIGVYFISEMRRRKGGRLSSSWIIFKNGRGNRISARTTLKTVPLTVSKSSLHNNNQNSNKEKIEHCDHIRLGISYNMDPFIDMNKSSFEHSSWPMIHGLYCIVYTV